MGYSRRPRARVERVSDVGGGAVAGVRPCRVCGETAGKHSYYGGQVQCSAVQDSAASQSHFRSLHHVRAAQHSMVRNAVSCSFVWPGLPVLPRFLPPVGPVRLQCDLLLCQGGELRGEDLRSELRSSAQPCRSR